MLSQTGVDQTSLNLGRTWGYHRL